ncbi:MAG: choice-of-anchor X domain-containing protein [Bacteroidota bacterium]
MLLRKSKFRLISFSIIAAFLFSSCDKIPGGVVDSQIVDYSVEKIEAPVSVTYSKSDSSVTTTIWLANNESVNSVWCKISSLDGQIIINPSVSFQFVYDTIPFSWQRDLKTYSAKFYMSKSNPSGKYQIEYFVENNINKSPNNTAKVGSALFTYGNNQNNLPPVISDVGLPTSVNRGDSFLISVKASDPNGLSDIYQVYFKLYRPDGSTVDPGNGLGYFIMFDDGSHGDQTAGDGIYSLQNYFGQTSQTGLWKFEFQAKDYGGKLSNVLTQNLTVN